MEIPDYLTRAILRHYRTLVEEKPDTHRGRVRIQEARRQAKGELRRLEQIIHRHDSISDVK